MPESDNFEISAWLDRIKAIASKELGDSTVRAALLEGNPSREIPLKLGPLSFSVIPEFAASIVLFNSKDDAEHDPVGGVVGVEDEESEPGEPVVFSKEGAWLAYHVMAGVKGEGGTDIGALGLSIEGEKVVHLCDYHFHPDRSQKIKDAIAGDFLSMRFAIRPSDITGIGPGEALAYRVRGKLSTTIEARWADALSANLNALSSLLRTNTPVAIKFEAGASIKVTAGVTDDFVLIFSRASENRIRVDLKKGKVSSLSTSPSAGITVEFANPGVIAEGVTRILEGVAGASVDKVDKLLQENVLSNLSAEQKGLFESLLKRLKLDAGTTDLLSLRTLWEQVKKQAAVRVESILKEKFAASFRYEYSRVRAESTLLQVKIPESELLSESTGLHSSLIKARASDILQWCRDNRIVPDKYMHERELTVEQSWGLSISLGKRFTIGGQDIEKLKDVRRENFQGNVQISFLGQRGYKGSWFGQKVSWMADLIADMPQFKANPSLSDFEFGLAFKWIWEEDKLSETEVDDYLDHAEIWRAIGSAADARSELKEYVGAKATISLSVTIGDFPFRQLLQIAASDSSDRAALAMGKAMPWDNFLARSIVERRTRLYAPLWKFYFQHPDRSYREYAETARHTLQQSDNGAEVAFIEGNIPSSSATTAWNRSFAELIRLNGTDATSSLTGIEGDWKRFRRGAITLQSAIAANGSPDQIKTAFKDFCPLWSQSLQLRGLGVYWIDLAAEHDLLEQVQRTLTIEPASKQAALPTKVIGVPSRSA